MNSIESIIKSSVVATAPLLAMANQWVRDLDDQLARASPHDVAAEHRASLRLKRQTVEECADYVRIEVAKLVIRNAGLAFRTWKISRDNGTEVTLPVPATVDPIRFYAYLAGADPSILTGRGYTASLVVPICQ